MNIKQQLKIFSYALNLSALSRAAQEQELILLIAKHQTNQMHGAAKQDFSRPGIVWLIKKLVMLEQA